MFSVQTMRARFMNLSGDIRGFVDGFLNSSERRKDDQKHVMTPEEKLDQTSEDSFPASDPPGHISKSTEDKLTHERVDSRPT
jgi:hypothetical protein